MPSRCRAGVAALLGGLLLLAFAPPALAVETSNSEFVIILEDDVFPEDLYAGAIRVVVDGTLEGDLVAFAAEEIVINGTVTGTVTAVTANVTVNGEVGESLRVGGSNLAISGRVGGDVVAAVGGAELSRESRVEGDVLVWAWDARAIGEIGGDLSGTQRNLHLAGDIGGDVDVSVTRLEVVDGLSVSGDLGYRSNAQLDGLDQADVSGAIVEKTPLAPNIRIRALGLLARLLAVVVLSVSALSIAYGWPNRSTTAIGEVGRTPLRRWLLGASILLSPVMATAVTALILGLAPAAVAFPLLAVLIPLILSLLGVAFVLALVSGAPTVGWLGGALFKRLDLYGSVLVGSIVVGLIWYLPFVGWLVPLLVLPLGLGAWIATWRGQSSESTPKARMEASSS